MELFNQRHYMFIPFSHANQHLAGRPGSYDSFKKDIPYQSVCRRRLVSVTCSSDKVRRALHFITEIYLPKQVSFDVA